MTREDFILSKPEFDFFYKPSGSCKTLECGNIINGEFESHRNFEFDESNKIISEVGYQSGWSAYPPGTTPPPTTQYLRKYTYENEKLKIISESEFNTKERLKSYVFNYSNHLISEIIETNENKTQKSPKRISYEYDANDNLIREIIYIGSIGDSKTYLTSEIVRNENNEIITIRNFNSVEYRGKLVSKQEISTKKFEYEELKVKSIFRSPNHNNIFVTTAEMSINYSDLVSTIIYPAEMGKKEVVYEYDSNNRNIVSKSTDYQDRKITEIYRYE